MNNNNNSNSVLYDEHNEILFWRVFHNVVLVHLIFKQIHDNEWIDYDNREYYQIHLDNKLKFKDIISLDWLMYNGQLELLKCKLKAKELLYLGELVLEDVFYELSNGCKMIKENRHESQELFKDIILLALNNEHLSHLFENKHEILKLLLQFNSIELFEIIINKELNLSSSTTISIHPALILEWSIRYSTPLIVDEIINLYNQHIDQDIIKSLDFSNVIKRSLKLALCNSYDMVNFILNGLKLNNKENISSSTDNCLSKEHIIKIVSNNLKFNRFSKISDNQNENENENENENDKENEKTVLLNNELLVNKVSFINNETDENGVKTDFHFLQNEELCVRLIELKCLTSYDPKTKEILSNRDLSCTDKLNMIKKMKKGSQKETTKVDCDISTINQEEEIEIRDYLKSIVDFSTVKEFKKYSVAHAGDWDPIIKNINLSIIIWNRIYTKPFCFYLYNFYEMVLGPIHIEQCNSFSNNVIECIEFLISNFNNSIIKSPNKVTETYIKIYQKLINYQFKNLLQCHDITIKEIKYILNIIDKVQPATTFKSKITIEHSIFHSFYYITLKSKKLSKFILELPFIKPKNKPNYHFGDYGDSGEVHDIFKLKNVDASFVEHYLKPSLFTFEHLFGDNISFDQILDEIINQLIYLPIKNIIQPLNHYNDTLNYILSYCLDIKRSDLFFKHLDIIQQQLNDKNINFGKFPFLIEKINNQQQQQQQQQFDSSPTKLLPIICEEYGFNINDDFKELNDGDRVFYYSDIVFGKACKLLSSNQSYFNRFISFCSFHSISNCILNPNFRELFKNYYSFKSIDIYKLLNITHLLNHSKLINFLISNHYQNYYNFISLPTSTTTITMNINSYWNHFFSLLKEFVSDHLYHHEFFFHTIKPRYFHIDNEVGEALRITLKNE